MEGLTGVSWGAGRLDLFWVGRERSLVHRWWSAGDGWSANESLGGQLAAPPAVTSWAQDEMQVFCVFDDGQLWSIYWDGAAWHEWHEMGGELVGQPAASSWGADRIDVFASGRDGALWHIWWDGTEWRPWQREPAA